MTTTDMKTLCKYKNGNCEVRLLKDGTKIIDFENVPRPQFPMSIDLKITNKCNAKCAWCHEDSCSDGREASPHFICHVLSTLPKGTEIALGGGNPLSYTGRFILSLLTVHPYNLIFNLTINSEHIRKYERQLEAYRHWIHGLGISWNAFFVKDILSVSDRDTILHFIAGVHDVQDALHMLNKGMKVLVLGYKTCGRGKNLNVSSIDQNQIEWKKEGKNLLEAGHVAFDTLALQQLEIKKHISKEVWDVSYMGEDGQLSMFIDTVTQTYAKSSTDKRVPIRGQTIEQMFQSLRVQ